MNLLIYIVLFSVLCLQANGIAARSAPTVHSFVRHRNFRNLKLPTSTNHLVVASQPPILSKNIDLPAHHGKGMSVSALVVNIIADLCPHGMLPLAYGMAQGGPTGIVPSVAILLLFGVMSAYSMVSYVKLAAATNSNSISEIWAKLVGRKYENAVDVAILSLCFGCCVFYSSFMGDIFGSLTTALGIPATSILSSRWFILTALSSTVLLPLCSLEDLSALEFSSFLGVVSIAYTVFFHVLRLIDGSYSPDLFTPRSLLVHLTSRQTPFWPSQRLPLLKMNQGTLVLANMACVAFLAHYNAISYFKELHNPTIKRYSRSIATGFFMAFSVFITMMFTGYSLFGMAAQPLLLNNFPATADSLAIVARLAIGVAITLAYPLMFSGLKSSLFSIFDRVGDNTQWSERYHSLYTAIIAPPPVQHEGDKLQRLKKMSILVVLGVITGIAIQCSEEEVSVVLGLVGSVLGCAVAYVLPGVLTLKDMLRGWTGGGGEAEVAMPSSGEVAKKDWDTNEEHDKPVSSESSTKFSSSGTSVVPKESSEAIAVTHYTRTEAFLHIILVVMGTVFGASGVWITLKSAGSHGAH